MQELERGDSGIRSMASVQSSLVMYPIEKYQSVNPTENIKDYPKASEGHNLDQLAELMVEGDFNKIAIVTDSKTVGVVTRRSLLRGIQGKSMDDLEPSKVS